MRTGCDGSHFLGIGKGQKLFCGSGMGQWNPHPCYPIIHTPLVVELPCKALACSSGATWGPVFLSALAQGHSKMQRGGVVDQTANLVTKGWPTLSPEPQPPYSGNTDAVKTASVLLPVHVYQSSIHPFSYCCCHWPWYFACCLKAPQQCRPVAVTDLDDSLGV